ncbi:MAG: glucose 1-dehydrogenase [Actinomycetota bacterium]|nr:glucose 1-dehydrogenase [Actinomycetota bacterium]
MELEDKVVIVTGAGQGIGRSYAEAIARAGAAVAVADVNEDAVTSLTDELTAAGHQAMAVRVDVSDEASTLAMADTVEQRFGRIDGLVNNAALYAGLQLRGPMDLPVDEWDRVMAVNVKGPFLCARAVVPAMRRAGGGSIVNQSSTGAWGSAALTHYTSSKAAVLGLTRSLAKSFGADGIVVNAIAPGQIGTEATLGLIPAERLERMSATQAIGRTGLPEDLCGAVVFLLSDGARFMTGQTLVVDGGLVML